MEELVKLNKELIPKCNKELENLESSLTEMIEANKLNLRCCDILIDTYPKTSLRDYALEWDLYSGKLNKVLINKVLDIKEFDSIEVTTAVRGNYTLLIILPVASNCIFIGEPGSSSRPRSGVFSSTTLEKLREIVLKRLFVDYSFSIQN